MLKLMPMLDLVKKGIITTEDSPIAMVIPTNEEFVIAQESVALMK